MATFTHLLGNVNSSVDSYVPSNHILDIARSVGNAAANARCHSGFRSKIEPVEKPRTMHA